MRELIPWRVKGQVQDVSLPTFPGPEQLELVLITPEGQPIQMALANQCLLIALDF